MHDISQNSEGDYLVAVNVNRGHPWHLLGKPVLKDMKVDDALELVGVGEEIVEPRTLYVMKDGPLDPTGYSQAYEEIEGSIAIHSSVFGPIATAGVGYEIISRREVLELAYEFVGLDPESAHIDTIGNLGERGDTFFAYIRVPDLVVDPNGVADVIENGLFAATSFNGKLPTCFGWSPIRPVCRNTVNMALPGLQQKIAVKHTVNAERRIRQAALAQEYLGAVEKAAVKRAEEMLRVNGDLAITRILDHFLPVDDTDIAEVTRGKRMVERRNIITLYEGPNNTAVDRLGRTGLAAFNAYVDYMDHARPVRGNERVVSRRAEGAVLPGEVMKKKLAASELVLN